MGDPLRDCMGDDEEKKYNHSLVMLQEKVGLTFKEARAVLSSNLMFPHELAEMDGVTPEAVYNLQRRGYEKINESGLSFDEIFEGQHMEIVLSS